MLCSCRLDYGKRRGNTKAQKESERTKHKYKKEFKGALREIRKDNRFMAREKLQETMSRYAESVVRGPEDHVIRPLLLYCYLNLQLDRFVLSDLRGLQIIRSLMSR